MAASIEVKTEIENPDGVVAVQAIASVERAEDARPVAGFYVRRRYDREVFLIARPEDFSPRWMRFVEPPPEDWLKNERLKKAIGRTPIAELMAAEPDQGPLARAKRKHQNFSMTQLADEGKRSSAMNYSNGRLVQRPNV